MTRDDIIRMAREAEFHPISGGIVEGNLLRFAAHVAAAEREACAKVCEEVLWPDSKRWSADFAAAIRARGQS
jgi:hypothetical protein